MTGEGAPPTASAPTAAAPTERTAPSAAMLIGGPAANATIQVDASVTTDVRVYLESDGDGEIELTSGVQSVVVGTTGSSELKVAARRLDAGTYVRARVVFSRADADVRSGLTIGGLAITGTVRVGISTQNPVEVEKTVNLQLEEDGTAAILIDLNATTWLLATSPVDRTVARTAFASAVEIRQR
jgi:hypothetical protein